MKEKIRKIAAGGLPKPGKQSTCLIFNDLFNYFLRRKMKKKWICTIAEDIGCPERTADGFCRIENCRCSFRTENENTLESEQKSGYVRKEKWFEKYYK